QIEVTFEIDANGILNVTAKDLGTGKNQSIRIEGTKKLSEDDIERMRQEAEKNKESDEKIQKLIQDRNELDSMAYQAEKLMKDNADKVEGDLKDKLLKAIEQAKDVVKNKGDNEGAIKEAKETLEKPLHELAQKIYAKAGGAPGGAPGGEPGGMPPDMEDMIRRAQQSAGVGGAGGAGSDGDSMGREAGYDSEPGPPKKKSTKRTVDVEWEDEDKK
ncbi:MAG: Hsp70 family protein, partial [Candidatus Lokiarchaeota archaeon]|nr:Hsp70 family protein [Candidatus Lokiarchaeota archaeon]